MKHLQDVVSAAVRAESLRRFSERTGVPVGVVRQAIAGGNLTYSSICSLVDALGIEFHIGPERDRREDEGLLGRGPDPLHPVPGDMSIAGVEFETVPLCDVNVSAGAGLLPIDEDAELSRLAFTRAWLARHRINAQLCGLVRVKGDGMAPTLQEGSLILVHAAEMRVDTPGIFAYARDGAAFVKRLRPLAPAPDGRPTSIVIVSDNQAYPPEVVSGPDLNDIRVVGRVRACLTSIP